MPLFRQYPETTVLQPTDAFVIDRIGVGTLYIEGQNVETGGGNNLAVLDEGTQITPAATSMNFVGDGVTATAVGSAVTVTIPGGSTSAVIAFRYDTSD